MPDNPAYYAIIAFGAMLPIAIIVLMFIYIDKLVGYTIAAIEILSPIVLVILVPGVILYQFIGMYAWPLVLCSLGLFCIFMGWVGIFTWYSLSAEEKEKRSITFIPFVGALFWCLGMFFCPNTAPDEFGDIVFYVKYFWFVPVFFDVATILVLYGLVIQIGVKFGILPEKYLRMSNNTNNNNENTA
ncbi:MAG: hypothetical protein ACRC2T_03625 [Thermoguttaceae bacterium]